MRVTESLIAHTNKKHIGICVFCYIMNTMKKALILHGMPEKEEYFSSTSDSPSNTHWIPWLQKELLLHGYLTQTPEFPEPYTPQYEQWVDVFNQFDIDENTTLIGHSCGAGFLVRYLSEHTMKIDTLVLVAPWIDPMHAHIPDFFNFEIDTSLHTKVKHIIMLSSCTDDPDVIRSVEIIKEKIPQIHIIEFADKGHFCYEDLGTRAFPELLEIIIQTHKD